MTDQSHAGSRTLCNISRHTPLANNVAMETILPHLRTTVKGAVEGAMRIKVTNECHGAFDNMSL